MKDPAFEVPGVRNFVILTALKLQQLMDDLRETRELNARLTHEHQEMKE